MNKVISITSKVFIVLMFLFLGTATLIAQTKLRGMNVSQTILTDSDDNQIIMLQNWNVNLIRLQLHDPSIVANEYNNYLNIEKYDKWINDRLDQLDKKLGSLQRNGIKVIIDLHTLPGGKLITPDMKSPDKKSHVEDRIFLDGDRRYRDKIKDIWKRIALRYKNSNVIWGYDLVNEPAAGTASEWLQLAKELAMIIREHGTSKRIIVESRNGDPLLNWRAYTTSKQRENYS